MKEIVDKNKCTGCTACKSICPKKAISMIENTEGFKYPNIDQNKCINCKLCTKICPANKNKNEILVKESYMAYNKDTNELRKCSSGAIFPLIANHILNNGGIVIGASFTKKDKLEHIVISNKKDLDKLKGSKYLQSDLNDIFDFIKENIKDKKILFVGTPCQVAGIKSIIKHDNLICVDIICHGVPSPKVFRKYIKELENKNNDKVLNYNFRDKIISWNKYSNTILFKNKKVSELASDNLYMKIFLSDVALRKSCYDCNFKLGNKYSDITLGDFWGIENVDSDFYNEFGVSCVIVNSEIGKKIFESIKSNINYKESNIDDICLYNPCLARSCKGNNNRDKFFNELDGNELSILSKKYIKNENIIIRFLRKVKNIIKKIINKVNR